MNIIIEGCDGTGKTTLAKYLAESFKMNYCHDSAPRSFNDYKMMLEYGNTVFDRFCYGQFIYNTSEQRILNLDELKCLQDKVFTATNTILIYVDLGTNEIIKRLKARNEIKENTSLVDVEKWIKNIRGTYKELFNKAQTKYIQINGDEGLCNILVNT